MSIRITLGTFFFDVKFRILHSYCRIINKGNGALTHCVEKQMIHDQDNANLVLKLQHQIVI